MPLRKALALLAYLAVEGSLHPRDRLVALLWPAADERAGRAALRNTLSVLRHALGEPLEAAEGAAGTGGVLRAASAALGVDADRLDLDVAALAAADVLARHDHAAEAPGLGARLERAAARYRGPFLDGLDLPDAPAFEAWALVRRARCLHHLVRVLGRLAALREAAEDLPGAIEALERLVACAPDEEGAWRRLIAAQRAGGDRAAARAAYARCRAALAELGTEPDAETAALIAEPAVAPRFARGEQPAGVGEAVGEAAALGPPGTLAAPLVGRAPALAALRAAYAGVARGGGPRVALLAGEAGIGKTRLAEAFLAWAGARGADALVARPVELNVALPYAPLVEMLRGQLERENAPDDLLEDAWLAELARLFPELRARYPDLPPVAADEGGRARLFEALARLFEALAARRPVALVLDDAQWADAATRDALRYALHRWAEERTRVLVVLCVRVEEVDSRADLGRWLADLERDAPTTRLDLGPLTAADTTRLLAALAARPVAASSENAGAAAAEEAAGRVGAWLHAETGGYPFFLMQTLQALLEEGVLDLRRGPDGGWGFDVAAFARGLAGLRPPRARRVRDTILARLGQLTPAATSLLMAGAVLGQRFPFARACGVAELSETAGLAALEEATRRRLLREDDAGGDAYAFGHDTIRAVVYEAAGTARRRVFHRRALDVLKGDGAEPGKLAHHAEAAGLWGPAARHGLAAGERALSLLAVRDAAASLERVERIDRDHDALAGADRLRLHALLGRAYELLAAWERARASYEGLARLARAAADARAERAALLGLASVDLHHNPDPTAAQASLARALALSLPPDDADAGRDRGAEGGGGHDLLPTPVLVPGFDPDDRGEAVSAPRDPDPDPSASSNMEVVPLFGVATGAFAAHRYAPRYEWIGARGEAAVALYAAAGNRPMEVMTLALVAGAQINAGGARRAVATARQADARAADDPRGFPRLTSIFYLSLALTETGAYEEALATAREGLVLNAVAASPLVAHTLNTALGVAYQRLLRLDEARAAYRAAGAASAALPGDPYAGLVSTRFCAVDALSGAWASAHAHARAALARRDYRIQSVAHFARCAETEALARGGDADLAEEDLRRYGARTGANRRHRVSYLRAYAALALWRGEVGAALAHLGEARGLAAGLGLPGELWRIEAALAAAHRARGDEEAARRAAWRAAAVVRALSARVADAGERASLTTSGSRGRRPGATTRAPGPCSSPART